MKNNKDTSEILKSGASELGVELDPVQLRAFDAYLAELVKWNRKVNLTAIEKAGDIVVKHFLDSLALTPLLPEGPFGAADIGAGAGFPGLPLKIARPDMRLTLVEPAGKKAAFLRQVIRLLGLPGAEVACERAEAFAEKRPGCFDVILSRAFREPSLLLGLVSPLLAPAGRVIVSLGPETIISPVPGWSVETVREITLPHSDYRRMLTVIKKEQPLQILKA